MPKRKHKHHHRPGGQQGRPVKPEVLPKVDMSLAAAATVNVPRFDSVEICVAGCGGTGSFMTMHAARLLRVLNQLGKTTHLTLVDDDVVKEENIGRQLFCDAEISVPKAQALARRYGFAWGLDTAFFVEKYDERQLQGGADLTILVGCVDGAEGRRALHETLRQNQLTLPFQPSYWWLDCGNVRHSGRVLLGSAYGYEALAGSIILGPEISAGSRLGGEIISLPSPALQYRDLLQPQPEELPDSNLDCAQLLAANQQSFDINASVAVEASKFLTSMLLTRNLRRYACEINNASGVVKSSYCIPEEIAELIKKPVGYLTKKYGERAQTHTEHVVDDIVGALMETIGG